MKVIVIGAGFSGLSTATYLARAGYDVEIIENGGFQVMITLDLGEVGRQWLADWV